MRSRLAAIIFLVMIYSTSCTTQAEAIQPPTIHYGEDQCTTCGMIINDPRFATAALVQDGEPLLFDDIGDYLSYQQAHHLVPRAVFVHDYRTQEWIRAETAWYLLSPNVKTPMGWGLAAFSDESAARELQTKVSGEVLAWHDLTSRTWPERPPMSGAPAR